MNKCKFKWILAIAIMGGVARGQPAEPQIASSGELAPAESRAPCCPGDMNLDHIVNLADLPLFVECLLAAGAGCGCEGDVTGDGVMNGLDISPFFNLLETGGECP